jgi:hexulose-6-phosphate isomerase
MNMTRRTFLETTLAAAAAATTAAPFARAQAGQKRSLIKGLNFGMIKAPDASVLDRFKMAREAGFAAIEINRPDAIPIDDLLAAKEETGLQIAGVVCSTHWSKPLSHPDEKVRAEGFAGFEQAIQDAAALGASTVLLVPGVVNAEVRYDECWERSQEQIRRAIPIAEKAGVRIAIENVWNHFLLSPMEAARYIDGFESPVVGWFFDVGNIVNYGWPEQWIRILGRRIINLHLKEFSRKKRDAEGLWKGFSVELGEGDVNWAAVMKALDAIGYQGFATAEVPGGDAARLKFLAGRIDELLAR